MALTNKLTYSFNFEAIDKEYDIYQITTSDRYISYGAYVLDKPAQSLKALSMVFDRGKNAFVLFKKDTITKSILMNAIKDEKIYLKKVSSSCVNDYVLLRIFLYSLSNYISEENLFNNIGGRLFLTHPSWKSKNGKNIKALEVSVDKDMQISAKATVFTSLSVFNKSNKKIAECPKYILLPNGKFRRALESDNGSDLFINKGIPGKKSEMPFLDLRGNMLKLNRAYFINRVLQQLNSRYSPFLTVSFTDYSLMGKVTERRDADFVQKSLSSLSGCHVYMTSLMPKGAYETEYESLKSSLSEALGKEVVRTPLDPKADMEIVFLHNEDYYQGREDPYKHLSRDHVVQCVTLEDSIDKIIAEKKAIINTLFKEMTIKDDILNKHRITLDDWSSFNFDGDWIFGDEVDNKKYFMVIHHDGFFEFEHQNGLLSKYRNRNLYNLSTHLDSLDLKGKSIIMDAKGNINVISRTNTFCMPNPEIFRLSPVSRSKEARERYLSGVIDINLFTHKGECYYNAGIVGNGMNASIPKANLLYKVTVVNGRNIIESVLGMMSVMFVKYNNFTVLPYPMKYLREYIKMNGGVQNK